MEPTDAWRVLGLAPCEDPEALRAAYAARLLDLHPDRSGAPGAHDATVELTAAYRTLRALLDHPGPSRPPAPAREPRGEEPVPVVVAQLSDDTIGIGAPPGEAFGALAEAGHRLGEVVHVEPSSGMLQVVVEFVDGPVCQLLLTLQGRATGVTEAFLTVEPIGEDAAPPTAAVTRLLLETLTG